MITMKTKDKSKLYLVIALILFLVMVTMIFTAIFKTESVHGASYPEWLGGEYKVGITLGGNNVGSGSYMNVLSTYKIMSVESTSVKIFIFYSIPTNTSTNGLKIRVRTRNGTAVAGVDYTSLDEIITAKRIYGSNESGYYDMFTVKINNNLDRFLVSNVRPYFDVELYDVLDDEFTIADNAKSVRIYISSRKDHGYSVGSAYGTTMLNGYLTASYVPDCSSLNIYSEDRADQTLTASRSYYGASYFTDDYKNLGLADYYVGLNFHIDEKGVSLSSWCEVNLYDGSTSGTHLYHERYRSIWNDACYPGIWYEDMKHEDKSFASEPYVFSDQSEQYDRLKAYYMRISSGTLYETFKNGSNYWRKTYGWNLCYIIIDDTAPKISGWYIDNSTIQQGDKIRISVRFNEPITASQSDLDNLKLKVVFNGTGGFNNYNATFDCVSSISDVGVASDTLIFEFNPYAAKDAYNLPLVGTINSFEVSGFTGLNKVRDYGRNQSNGNNYCGNYTTLQQLEAAKMAPRQLKSNMTISFDNRSPVIDQTTDVTNNYQKEFTANVTTSGTTKLQGVYYLWSTSPDLNYEKVNTPFAANLNTYYEINNNNFVATEDVIVDAGKTYYVKRDFNLAKAYEFLKMNNVTQLPVYEDVCRFKEFTSYSINYSADGNFSTTLSGVSGTYYLHVYAKSIYSDDVSAFRKFGPIKVDNEAPVFSNISATKDLLSKDMTVNFQELSGFKNIVLYAREIRFDVDNPEYETKKLLLYGTINDETVIVPEESFNTIIDLPNNLITCTIDAEKHIGLEDGEKEYGDYYLGIVGTDLAGNTSILVSSENQVSFDLRSQFAPFVKIDGVEVTDSTNDREPIIENVLFYAENSYVVDISEGAKTIVIGRPGNVDDTENSYFISSVNRYEDNKKTNLEIDLLQGIVHEKNDSSVQYFINYSIDKNGNTNPFVTFDIIEPGYYEVTTCAVFTGEEFFSRSIRIYVTNGNETSVTKNYDTIVNVGVNFKNKLFVLNSGRYYARTGTGMGSSVNTYYNDSMEPVVFSSSIKAAEYVKAMEYRDLYAIRITAADVQAYNNGVIVAERGEPRRPEIGEIWVRYKADTWNFSTNQRDWVYYYYGDTSMSLTIDVDKISGRLNSVINQVVNTIIQKGSDLYLNSMGGVSENGALYVNPDRIPGNITVTTSIGSPSTDLVYNGALTNPLSYTFDNEIYYDKYNDADNVKLISSYKFTQTNSTKIYYAAAKYDGDNNLIFNITAYKSDLVLLNKQYLTQAVEQSGVYFVRELDEKGMRDYFVYVDKDTPTILGQYYDLGYNPSATAEENNGHIHYNQWLKKDNSDGTVLHTTAFTLSLIEDKPYSPEMEYDNYHNSGVDADTYTYIAIFNITNGEKVFEKGLSLNEFKDENQMYEFPNGIFLVEVSDRAGNQFSMTISVAEQILTSEIEVINNDKVTIMIPDRIPAELESVYVVRPGKPMEEVDFEKEAIITTNSNGKECYSLTYTDDGSYEFIIVDKYGYTLSPSTDTDPEKIHTTAELIRVNPYENVSWVIRSDEGQYLDFDTNNISLFHSDTYYITSDDKLTFILDSTTIYSYVFTGNVTYQEVERTINNKRYLYVNVDSTERWTVRIYYTLYPDIAVTYNRIAKKAVVPASINLRAAEKDAKGIAQADQTNRIVVYVGTQDEMIDNIVVRLRTRDRSAIASLGDYDSFEGTVTLTPTNKEQMVVIQTHPSGISTYNSTTYEFAKRTFDLYIESIEGNAEKGRSTMECACPGQQELNIFSKDGIQVFEDYLEGSKHGLSNIAMEYKSSADSKGDAYDYNNYFSVSPAWVSTFISSGLANVYVTGGLSVNGDDDDYYPKLRVTLSETSKNKQLFRVYVGEIEEEKSISFGSSYDGLKISGETYDGNTSITISENRGNAVAGRYFLAPTGTNGNFNINIHEDEGVRTVYSQMGVGVTYLYILPDRNINNLLGYAILIDNTAPSVVSWHIDHNTVCLGDNLRLSVRFSEPVYISGKEPYVSANITGTAKDITFNYAGGAGTDTLYFEYNPSANTSEFNVDAITITSLGHFSSICDYAYNASKQNNVVGTTTVPKDTEWDNSCSLDTRIPAIEMDGSYIIPSGPQRSASVPLNISKIEKGAQLEYSWTVESDAPAIYEKKMTLNSSDQKITLETRGISGVYYLHIYTKSVYGKVATRTYGPFLLDNAYPTVTGLTIEEATKGLKERNVVFYVSDEPKGQSSSGLAQVYMYYFIKGDEAPQLLKLYDKNGDEKQNRITISESNRVSFLLRYSDLGIPAEDQKDVTIAFYAVDGLGNSATISGYTFCPTTVNFDSRSEVGVSMTASKEVFFDADGIPVYNVAGGMPNFDFAFSRQADEYDIRQLFISGKEITEDKYSDYLDYTSDIDGVHVKFKNTVIGHIRINFKAISGTGDNHTVQEASDVVFYLTNGTDKSETGNYKVTENGTLLINKVYMLNSATYYYHNGEGVRQQNYNDTNKFMAFSSREKAIEYVTFYEMQDLGILEIKSTPVASALNTGDGSYRKAALDASVNAAVGQIWIRYKRATWDNVTTSDGWVYYYLGTSSEIDPERLPASLSAAIAQVSESIVDKGGYRYLTSDGDGLDKNGSPYLDKKQIITTRLTSYVTNTGEELRNAVVFTGDPSIYNSFVTPAGEDEPCSLVTTYNFTYGDFTKLFYTNKIDAQGAPIAKEFKLLPAGTVFGSLNIDGGVYWIRECDETGVRDYKVYLDKTAPAINVIYENAKGDSIERELDASIDGMSINGKVLRIKGFSSTSTEIDTMSYIAIFKKNGVLVNVYRAEDIVGTGVEVGEGQYYIEVADRSGNMYKVNVSLNSTPMTVKVIPEENKFVRITCNRDSSEIKLFEIYLDNKIIESNYSASVTYYQSGVYSIHIEDWFGNSFNYDYELKRELPKINWFYEDGDNYVAFDGTQSSLKISKSGDREYQIITNKALMFTYDSSAEYEYEFSDRAVSVTAREFNGISRVRINDETDWELTVRYARYSDIYVVYKCITDRTPPLINVSARQDVVKYFDQQSIDEINKSGLNSLSDEYFVPDTVFFAVTKTISKAVRNNLNIYSTLITLQFEDKSICSEVEIYVDGVMIREYAESEGVSNITVNRFGEYRIVARDALGNQSEFCFVNQPSTAFKYLVDGKEVDIKLSPADAITKDDNNEYIYPADTYSFDNIEFMYSGSGKIAFLVEKDGEKSYLRYECIDGALYEVVYKLMGKKDPEGNPIYDENDEEIWQYEQVYATTIIPDMTAITSEKSFVLTEEDVVGAEISIRFDKDGNVYYHVQAPKTGEITVSVRINYNDEYQPYFTKTVMSGELPQVTFEHYERVDEELEKTDIIPTSTDQIIYLNGEFYVKETSFTNITEISIAYSTTTEFSDYRIVYSQNEGYKRLGNKVSSSGEVTDTESNDATFVAEGFYSVVAKNIYGRIAKFVLTLSNDLRAEITAEYKDGYSTKHVVKSNDSVVKTFKANDQVTIDVYTEKVDYRLTVNGVEQEIKHILDSTGMCSITWEEEGTYHLVVIDQFKNEITVDFVIEDKPFVFKNDYLTGYNEDALRKDEGYSNKKLSVDAEKMIADGIKQVSIIYNDVETACYDVLREDGTPVSNELITEVIGKNGDGIYILKMRNENGNVVEQDLHYMGTDTMMVSRLIRTSREAESIAITAGEINKIYSNYSVTFESIASKYEIRVDGDKADMPLTIRYPSDVEETGEYKQNVTYVDEYGYKYTFEVNLVRKKLDINLAKNMKLVVINDVVMTQDDVSIDYDQSVSCVYTLNGGDRIPYTSGEKLTADGTYRFYITDIAGNVHSASVKKDTLVEFTFTYAGTDRIVENGSVITEGSGKFTPINKDSSKIELAVLNGEEKDSKASSYGESGKWEFIISDDIGNKAYYYFYVVTHSLSYFEYESPYAYKITSIEYDSGDGVVVSYVNLVQHNVNKNNSTMRFTETGAYQVTVSSVATAAYFTFGIWVDKTPPAATLVGVEDGSSTISNVSLANCQVGDVIRVYKDGKLTQTIEVTSSSTKMPEVTEKGDYKFVITNAAGNEQTFEFTRKYTANIATTIVIIVVCLLIAAGLTIILFMRKRKKV